jgi:hypothetical protein
MPMKLMKPNDRLAPYLWLAYLVIPVEGWGLFAGRPLGALDALALVTFCWLWWLRRPPAFALLAAGALAAKVVLGVTLLAPRGFDARYQANADFKGPVEIGTEPADPSFTRTDTRLSFGGPGDDRDLPLYFYNDIRRFNFYLPQEPARATLPVSVVWEGWLRVTGRTGLRRVYVRSPGGHAGMTLGDGFAVDIPPSTTEWVGYTALQPGFRRIRIALSIPQGAPRAFEAGWTIDGREEPFDGGVVFRQPVRRIWLAADWVMRVISTAFDVVLCGWLIAGAVGALKDAWPRLASPPAIRDALAIAWAVVAVDAFLFARPLLHRMVTLSGGDDWLNYESRARDIGLHGLWMLNGAMLGQGQAFYQMPGYPYFVAAVHWLFGDDLYGVHLVQRLMVGGSVIALWRVTAAIFGERVGCAGLIAALVIVYEKVGPWSGFLLNELLFVPLVCLWALQLVKLGKTSKPSLPSAAGAGLVGGLATLTRSSLMLGWPFVLALVPITLGRGKRAGRIVAVIALAMMAVTSLATIRNWVVARQFVLVSTYGPINLKIGNWPPEWIAIPAEHKAFYTRFGVDPDVQIVAEYARQSPRLFFKGWVQKAAYSLGSYSTLAPDRGRSVFYMVVSSIAFLGVLLLMARASFLSGLRGAGPASIIPLALALVHFASLVIFFPTVYGDRQLIPFYALVAPYVGIAAYAAHTGVWRLAGARTALLLWGIVFGLSAVRQTGRLLELDVALMAVALLGWGLCVCGVPRLRSGVLVVYAAIIAAVCIWAAVRGTGEAEYAARMDLLLVATAACSSVIIASGSGLRLPERSALAWLGAGLTIVALAVLHRSAAGAPMMVMTGLVLGAIQPLRGRLALEKVHAAHA